MANDENVIEFGAQPTVLDRWVNEYLDALEWGDEVTQETRDLVFVNLRGFANLIGSRIPAAMLTEHKTSAENDLDPKPICPHCAADPLMVFAHTFNLGPFELLLTFCKNCRKSIPAILWHDKMGGQQGRIAVPQMTPPRIKLQ